MNEDDKKDPLAETTFNPPTSKTKPDNVGESREFLDFFQFCIELEEKGKDADQ